MTQRAHQPPPGRSGAFPWEKVLSRLADFYHVGNWKVPYLNARSRDPFRVLVSTILSQRTRDEVTYPVADHLFELYPDARSLARVHPEEIEAVIRSIGFYRAKARAIHQVAVRVLQDGGQVPSDLERLLSLPMVGRKTANCVLVYGFDIPAIPVDTHVHRISNLLGAVATQTPEETEMALLIKVPKPLWKGLNPLLVQHGQNVCRPLRPKCPACPVRLFCATGRKWKPKEPPGGSP